ncbi:MAG: DUF4432 family protein [Pseudomonadota bacterium]
MTQSNEDQRRRSVLSRALAEIRQVEVTDGPAAGSRILEVRTPTGLSLDIALDRGGDISRMNYKGHELGWHSAADMATPWPVPDTEDGLGFLRGFDGFLVTCGLDHHGVATQTDASNFKYPLRKQNHHPLHGRIMTAKAEVAEKHIDWDAVHIRIKTIARQASVFGEVLELRRVFEISLETPTVKMIDEVANMGFRPTRHGILYHFNMGYPLLDSASRLTGDEWTLRNRLDGAGAVPDDNHVEIVDAKASPADGRIGMINDSVGFGLTIGFDPKMLPATALWRAFQSGVFACGLEPQTVFDDANAGADMLQGGAKRIYKLDLLVVETA